jgi:hypothetical protein
MLFFKAPFLLNFKNTLPFLSSFYFHRIPSFDGIPDSFMSHIAETWRRRYKCLTCAFKFFLQQFGVFRTKIWRLLD